jgi:hypothetical protein
VRKEKVRLIDSIIESINESLEKDTWTMEEFKAGKIVEIKSQWSADGVLEIVKKEYIKNGWDVTRHVELSSNCLRPFHYLRFINPNYHRSPKEIRGTGVRTKRKKIIF